MSLTTSAAAPVTLTETGLEVLLPGGKAAYFNNYWLRDNCPTSFDSQTRERVFDIFHLEAAPRPRRAEVVGVSRGSEGMPSNVEGASGT